MTNKMLKAKSYIEDIKAYVPGKNNSSNPQRIIKLSSNENSLGSSPNAIKEYLNIKDNLFRYPQGSSEELRNNIAKKYNINANKVVCGSGSDEIISLLVQAFLSEGDEIIQSEYGFLMYQISAQKNGAITLKAKENKNNNIIKTNIDNILELISYKTKIIFIANPNNPTGSYINEVEFQKLIDNVPKNILIIMDLAYAEYVDEKDYPDVIKYVDKYENVVMMRTFSKIHGLASLRVGWGYSSNYIADILNKVRGPFNITMPAQKAASAAILDDEFIKKSKNHNKKELDFVKSELLKLNIIFYDSVANFILIDFKSEEKCRKINEYLLEKGIILRDVKAYNLPSCLRMTIGTRDENKFVILAIKAFFKS
jgi:histidinol-phosphate aminotransferase